MFGPPSSSSRVRMPFARSASTPSCSRSRASRAESSSPASFSNLASSMFRSLLAKAAEGVAFEAHGEPFGHHLGAQRSIEAERRLVPVQHLPLEPPASFADGDPGKLAEERLPDSVAPMSRKDEKVFQVQTRPPEPGRPVVEVEGEAGRLSVPLAEEDVEAWRIAETIPEEVRLGRHHRAGGAFVGCELAYESQNDWDVGRRPGPQGKHGRTLSHGSSGEGRGCAAHHAARGEDRFRDPTDGEAIPPPELQ